MLNTQDIFFSIYEIDGRIKINNFKSNLNIFTTPWSIAHFISGYMTQACGINYLYGLVIHTIYEYVNYTNYTIKNKWSGNWVGFRQDSLINTIGDTFYFLLGMILAKNYNNIYLFIFIFLIGVIFFSLHFQHYLRNMRLSYLKSKDNTIKFKNAIFKLPDYSYNTLFIAWIIVSLVVFIKLKISNKSFKF